MELKQSKIDGEEIKEGEKIEFQLIFNGQIKYFKEIEKLLEYIKSNIEDIPYCVMRKFYPKKHCVRFMINREVQKKDFYY